LLKEGEKMKKTIKIALCLLVVCIITGCTKIQPPSFLNIEGKVAGGVQVGITSNVQNSKTYYTTDGSIPTIDSDYFIDGLKVVFLDTPGIQAVKAATTKNGKKFSEVVTKTVTVPQLTDVPELYNFDNLLVISNYDKQNTYIIGSDKIEKTKLDDSGLFFMEHEDALVILLTPEFHNQRVSIQIEGTPGYANSEPATIDFKYILENTIDASITDVVADGFVINLKNKSSLGIVNYQLVDDDGSISELKQGSEVIAPWTTSEVHYFLTHGDDLQSDIEIFDIDYQIGKPDISFRVNNQGFLVTITAKEDAKSFISDDLFDVFYTLDGSDPSTSDTAIEYTESFIVPSEGVTIKASQSVGDINSMVSSVRLSYEVPQPKIDYKLSKDGFYVTISKNTDAEKRQMWILLRFFIH
jgi:hypothetical protein